MKENLPQQRPPERGEEKAPKETGSTESSSVPSEKGLSAFEAYVQEKMPQAVSMDIRQFGYDLFERPPSTFAPVDTVPVGPDYLLGPGDEIRITIWGKVNAEYSTPIDVEGKISLPQIGILHISGLTFQEAKNTIEKEFARYYKPEEVKINISTGRLRSIRVFVVGKAQRPGSYTLSSLSTLVSALFAAGGPSKNGTMRDIQVKRNGGTVVHFDMYDFLLKGDKTKDIRLMPEDVIFIPPVGPLVGIAGNVNTPAIYELRGETTLSALVEMAGGLTATGYLQQVQLERIFENRAKVVTDIDFTKLKEEDYNLLKDGDIIKVFSISQAVINPVELKGNLLRPGRYEWRDGIKVKDLIRSTDDLLPDTLLEFALIERLIPPDYHKEYLSIALGKLLLEGDERENIELKPYDTVVVFKKGDLIEKEKVRVAGAVNRAGEYDYQTNMKLSDLLKLAGGLKRYSNREEAELSRVMPTPDGPVSEKVIVNPAKALEGETGFDIPLRPDDYLFVRTVPEWELYKTVTINGEVRFPGVYTIEKGETLSSLIKRAGGFTDKAYLKGAIFTRESVRKLQQRQIDEAIDRLEHQILSQSAKTIETALTPEEAEQKKGAAEQRTALIAKMKAARAKGRVSIKLDTLDKFERSSSDIILEDGDSLTVPEKPQQVQVIGAVYNQTAFVYEPDGTVTSYINKAGGMTKDADKDEMYVLKVDGTAVSRKVGRGFGNNWTALDPGDTIVVPEKIEKIAWLREIKDITQILYQIAVTAGVLIVAF